MFLFGWLFCLYCNIFTVLFILMNKSAMNIYIILLWMWWQYKISVLQLLIVPKAILFNKFEGHFFQSVGSQSFLITPHPTYESKLTYRTDRTCGQLKHYLIFFLFTHIHTHMHMKVMIIRTLSYQHLECFLHSIRPGA